LCFWVTDVHLVLTVKVDNDRGKFWVKTCMTDDILKSFK
jgi:hypothetical protein